MPAQDLQFQFRCDQYWTRYHSRFNHQRSLMLFQNNQEPCRTDQHRNNKDRYCSKVQSYWLLQIEVISRIVEQLLVSQCKSDNLPKLRLPQRLHCRIEEVVYKQHFLLKDHLVIHVLLQFLEEDGLQIYGFSLQFHIVGLHAKVDLFKWKFLHIQAEFKSYLHV